MAENNQLARVTPALVEPLRHATYETVPADLASVNLSHYLWILKRHRWKLVGFVFATVMATLIISKRVTPVYESTATVDVDRQMPTGVIGQDSMRSATNDADQFLATQIKLIQSDSVLRPVALKYNLREVERGLFDSPLLHTARAEKAPVVLKKLEVTRPRNTYLLQINYRSTDPELAANVANGIAQSYLEHTYNIRFRSSAGLSAFMERQLEELKAKMERSSAALAQFEKELNVINPEEKTSILSARLLQLNTEYTNAQADRVRKEAAFASVRNGSLEAAAAQMSTQGESLKRISERADEVAQRFAEVKTHYDINHPEYRKAAVQVEVVQKQLRAVRDNIAQRVETEYREALNREAMLRKAVAETKAEFDRLNARSFEYQALKREAEADKKLYEELVRKIKEAGINASFQNSSIRIADLARPGIKPVSPDIPLNCLLAFLFSSLAGVGAAVLSDVLDTTMRDPEQVSRTLNTVVVGTLPMVKTWRSRLTLSARSAGGSDLVALGEAGDPTSISYNEAIRTLRNSILLADFDRRIRSLLVTSASPGEGKSTIAAHLAVAHAEQKQRTLLIDGDLRRPSLHKHFGVASNTGLSQVLAQEKRWQETVVRLDGVPNLDIMPAGPPSRRAADVIGSELLRVLEEASALYDLVILDAPPLLGFAEPLQMATAVDGVVVVTRAGQTNRKAVASVMSTLHRLRANVVGVVLNEVYKELSDSYYYYSYHGKYYRAAGG